MAPEAGLTRATFAKLSPHPYLLANLSPSDSSIPPARSNGRGPLEVRAPIINLSSLSYAHGSALVRAGDTTVICGVRGETILTKHIPNHREGSTNNTSTTELADYDLLVPNIELATGSAPQFLPGGPPTTLAQTLSTRIYSLLHSSKLIQPDDLRIWHQKPPIENPLVAGDYEDDEKMQEEEEEEEEGGGDTSREEKGELVIAYWVLYIDIFFVSFDGNPFDAAWAAVLAALRDTKLPRARYDPDREMILCARADPRPLTIDKTPVACTAVVFRGNKERDAPAAEGRHWLLADPDTLEEALCDESVTIVVDCAGGGGGGGGGGRNMEILSVAKHGGTLLTPGTLRSAEFLDWAAKRWEGLVSALEASTGTT